MGVSLIASAWYNQSIQCQMVEQQCSLVSFQRSEYANKQSGDGQGFILVDHSPSFFLANRIIFFNIILVVLGLSRILLIILLDLYWFRILTQILFRAFTRFAFLSLANLLSMVPYLRIFTFTSNIPQLTGTLAHSSITVSVCGPILLSCIYFRCYAPP